MKSKLIKEFNLPNYIKGKSFAEASKAIDAKFKGRENSEALATKKELLSRLSKAQEYTKMQSEVAQPGAGMPGMNQMPGGENPAMSQPQNKFFFGGKEEEGGGSAFGDMDKSGKIGAVAGDAGLALGFAQDALGDTGVDTSGLAGRQDAVDGRGWSAAGAGLQGAAAGAKYGPLGAAIGGVVGVGSSLIGSGRKDKAISDANMNAGLIENNKFSNDFSKGGKLRTNDFSGGGKFGDKFKDVELANTPQLTLGNYGITGAKNKWQMNTEGTTMEGEDKLVNSPTFNTEVLGENTARYDSLDGRKHNTKVGNAVKGAASWGKENFGDILRTAPAIGNALQLANMKKADKVRLDRIESRYKPDYVDEKALENKVQNESNNTTRALAGASNGSMGALRSSLLGSQLNKTNALSDSYLKADGINRAENAKAQDFNNRNEHANLRQGTLEQQMNDQNEGAFNSAKSALQSQLANDIGNFGKEKVNMKQVAEMFGYTWDGKYMVDKDGNKTLPKDLDLDTTNKVTSSTKEDTKKK